MVNERLRLHLIKRDILKSLEKISLKKFLLFSDESKRELFDLFRYLTKGR